jgi:murein DD-endopeptidase MepM/ murein hydrolase activator NlpD
VKSPFSLRPPQLAASNLRARAQAVRSRLHQTKISAWQVLLATAIAIAVIGILTMGALAFVKISNPSAPNPLSSLFAKNDTDALRDQLLELHRRMETMQELKEQFATIANPLASQSGSGRNASVMARPNSNSPNASNLNAKNLNGTADSLAFAPLDGKALDAGELIKVATLMNERLELAEQQWLRELRVLHQLPTGSPIANHAGMSSDYGTRLDPFTKTLSHHAGIDFKAEHGTPILATGDGVVAKVDVDRHNGQYVEIEHASGFTTRYAHVSRFAVKAGETVKRGQVIANVGNTGRSTSPHLHYEIRYQGIPINPLQALAPKGNQQVASSAPAAQR